eukprot:366018-Chlamydomonas_euryale.AAC.1
MDSAHSRVRSRGVVQWRIPQVGRQVVVASVGGAPRQRCIAWRCFAAWRSCTACSRVFRARVLPKEGFLSRSFVQRGFSEQEIRPKRVFRARASPKEARAAWADWPINWGLLEEVWQLARKRGNSLMGTEGKIKLRRRDTLGRKAAFIVGACRRGIGGSKQRGHGAGLVQVGSTALALLDRLVAGLACTCLSCCPRTAHVPHMYSLCTAHVQPMYCPCTAHVPPMYSPCTAHGDAARRRKRGFATGSQQHQQQQPASRPRLALPPHLMGSTAVGGDAGGGDAGGGDGGGGLTSANILSALLGRPASPARAGSGPASTPAGAATGAGAAGTCGVNADALRTP